MARLGPTGLTQVFTDIKNWVNSKLSTKADTAHTHTTYAVKHAYTTAANAAKNWYRIANANTKQVYTGNPIHAEFILTAYNSSYDPGYSERWYVRAMVLGRNAYVVIFGGNTAPFSQCRVLYENTLADIDDNDRPAIDIYLNYVLANGTTKIEIEEVYNQGWTFVANGQLAVSTVPTGFENTAVGVRGNGVERSTYSDIATYLNKPRRDITSDVTLADNNTYRSTTLNCTGTRTITLPSINSNYFWCVIKNFNAEAGIITIHPSTTSVLIDGSNDDIILRPGEFVAIHSGAANSFTIVGDNRKRTCLVGRSGVVGTDTKHWFRVAQKTIRTTYRDAFILFDVFQVASDSSYMGRLCAHVRVDNTIGVVGNKQFKWLYRGTQLSDDDFAMTTIETSGTSVVVDIWCKRAASYGAFAFAIVSEGFSTDSLDSPYGKWILTRERATVGDLESLDTGFTTVTNPTVVTLANSITGNAGSATVAQQVRKDPAAGSTADLLYSQCAGTDIFRLQVGGASNAGYAEIATADDGSEPIYVRQYKGTFTSLQRTATLLDGSGNTSFPGQVTGVTFNGPLTWSGTAFSYNAGNSLYYYSGQPAIANCFEGSSNDFTKFSYPAGGTAVSSSNANIQTLRLDWGNTYWHDLFMSPNNNYLWHRNVVNSDARGWRRIVEENVTGLTDQSWNINIAGNATTVTGTAGTSTLAWDSEVTLYTVGGNAIKAKLPANPNSDTKNTAGSTDSSSKLFLIGATTQEANPQTYSHDTAYVGTDGCLYSGGAKVLTAHQSLANYVTLNTAQEITNTKTFKDANTVVKRTDIEAGNTLPSADKLARNIFQDKNGKELGSIYYYKNPSGNTGLCLRAGDWFSESEGVYSLNASGTNRRAELVLYTNSSGDCCIQPNGLFSAHLKPLNSSICLAEYGKPFGVAYVNKVRFTNATLQVDVDITATEEHSIGFFGKNNGPLSYITFQKRPSFKDRVAIRIQTSSSAYKSYDFDATCFYPESNNSVDIGSTTNIFKNIYCNNYYKGTTAFGDIVTHNASEFLTSHPTITLSTNTTSTASPAHGGTFTCIDSVTQDTNGHITKVNTKTITLPADNNTDTKVTQTVTTANSGYPVLLCATANATATETTTSRFSEGLTVNARYSAIYMTNKYDTANTKGVRNTSSYGNGYIVFRCYDASEMGRIHCESSKNGYQQTYIQARSYIKNGAISPEGTATTCYITVRVRDNGSKTIYTDGSWENSLTPYANNTHSLGTSSLQWKNAYAVNFYENGTALSSKYAQIDNISANGIGTTCLLAYFPGGTGDLSLVTGQTKPGTSLCVVYWRLESATSVSDGTSYTDINASLVVNTGHTETGTWKLLHAMSQGVTSKAMIGVWVRIL